MKIKIRDWRLMSKDERIELLRKHVTKTMKGWMLMREKQIEQTTESVNTPIEILVELYHQKVPAYWASHQEGVQAGIRYALLAMNKKVKGIN